MIEDAEDRPPAVAGAGISERLRGVLDSVADGITVQSPDGRLVYANAAALRLIGYASLDELLASAQGEIASRFTMVDEAGEPVAVAALPGRQALAGVRVPPATIGFRVNGAEEQRWALVRAEPLVDDDGRVAFAINTFHDITDRVRIETDLRASESRYRLLVEDAKRAEDRLRLLAEATVRLDQTLDLEETVAAAATLATSALGDWCIVDLLDPDGTQRASVASATPAPTDLVGRLMAGRTDPAGSDPAAVALREGRPVLDAAIAAVPAGDGSGLPGLMPTSTIAVPLIARGRTLGVMTVVSTDHDRPLGGGDLDLAAELGRRAALAIANAELYAAEQTARRAAEASAARTDALQRLTLAVARASTLGEIIDIAVRDAVDVLGAAGVIILAPNDEGQLELLGSGGYVTSDIGELRVIDPSDPLPVAEAFRRREAVWMPDVDSALGRDRRVAAARARSRNASLCAVPLLVEGRAVGVLGLAFRTRRDFERADRELLVSQAAVLAQAFDRVMLGEARERLVADLEEQRNRLVGLIDQMPAGVVIADADGTVSVTNRHAGEIWRRPVPTDRRLEDYGEFEAFGPDGRPFAPGHQPLVRALRSGETTTGEQVRIRRFDGSDGWIAVDAAPITDRDGRIVAAVSTFTDVTAQHLAVERQAFLAEATALLSSSLDYEETIRRVARLAVPRMADWCAVDLVGPSGALDQIVVAHIDPAQVELARSLRERYPPSLDAETGVAAVVREGRSELVSEIPAETIATIADPEIRRIMEALRLRSYMCVPLIAGGTTLGAITFVGAESGLRYTRQDLALAEDLAARAAAAIENARLFRDVGRYKRILDATLDAVFMFDPGTLRFSYVNQGAIDQVGLDRSILLGLTPAAFVVDFDEPRIRDLIAPLVARRLDSRTVTLAHRHTSGRRIPVEVLFQYVELAGEPGRIVAVARDISDRVEAQSRLQRLAEAEHARAAELNAVIRTMGEGVVVCEADGRISLANPAAEQLFPDVARGDYASILAALDDPDGRAPELGVRGGPVELRVRGGDERWVELSTYPVAGHADDHSGGTDETIVLVRDVSDARQRQAVRDTFLGVLSHELRTPVTTIYAGSKVLARSDSLDDDVRRSVFEDIHAEAERLHRLIEDVIALRRFGEEEGEVGSEPLLLQRILPGVVRSEEARWPGVRFDLQVPTGLPTVIADPTYVEQVVRNLLSNAAKYGGPPWRVETIVEAGDGEVIVRILDDGPGFPPAEAERLFELFFRSPSTASVASGAGIGLFVCARLIRAMGGRIWARPRGERGAEFGFSLRMMADE